MTRMSRSLIPWRVSKDRWVTQKTVYVDDQTHVKPLVFSKHSPFDRQKKKTGSPASDVRDPWAAPLFLPRVHGCELPNVRKRKHSRA